MRSKATLIVATGLFFAGLVPGAQAECVDADLPVTAETVSRANEALFCLHNEERARAGLTAFRWSTLLAQAASNHTTDMTTRGYFEHESPEGETPSDRLFEVGYAADEYLWAGAENISWGTGQKATPRATLESWMKSAPHRANILDGDLRDIGFGIAPGAPKPAAGAPPNSVTYTTNFGSRDARDDSTVLSSPSGTPVAPEPAPVADPAPGADPAPVAEPPAESEPPPPTSGESVKVGKSKKTKKRKLKKCLRKAKGKRGKVARKKARNRCKKRFRGKRR
jgi:uncharacterized protein YkwD